MFPNISGSSLAWLPVEEARLLPWRELLIRISWCSRWPLELSEQAGRRFFLRAAPTPSHPRKGVILVPGSAATLMSLWGTEPGLREKGRESSWQEWL